MVGTQPLTSLYLPPPGTAPCRMVTPASGWEVKESQEKARMVDSTPPSP
jgi:hypothetical protein